jgi:hypothetical protein
VKVTKGNIGFEVQLNDDIKITTLVRSHYALSTAKVIASTLKKILQYYTSQSQNSDKAEVVRSFFSRNGWNVEE